MPLVAFDFDGTLADSEMTVLLGRVVDAEAEMATITERAMAGELPYAESLRRRVALLKGLSLPAAERALDGVALRPGAADVLAALAAADVPTAILTGGFERGVEAALSRANAEVDRVVANRLVVEDGVLTGDVEGPLVEVTKDEALRAIAADLAVPMPDTVAVGDGANDRSMLEAAGLAVGYEPKAAVLDAIDASVGSMAELERLLRDRGVLPD